MQEFRTFHNDLHITHETMHHAQGLCNSHLCLVLGQSIQSLQNSFNLAIPQQFLGELLYGTLSRGQCICDGTLTKSPLLDMLCREGEHQKDFDHDLDNDIGHRRSGWDCHIYLKTLEETSQALKKFQESVVTR